MMKMLVLLACFILIASPIYAHAAKADTWNITDCIIEEGGDGLLNESGTYYLSNNCIGNVKLQSSNIILDCQGYSITSSSPISDDFLFSYPYSNITIENCVLNTENTGIYIEGIIDSTFRNNTFNGGEEGIQFDLNMYNVSNNYIYNNTFLNSTYSILLYAEGSGYFIENNFIYNNSFSSEAFIDTEYGIETLFNNWNTSNGGNFWVGFSDNATACGTCNAGICSNPYVIDENNTDYLPLCNAESECVPSWNCTSWGPCLDGYQSRECTDSNQCGDNRTKPSESQICEMPFQFPNATYNQTGCCPIFTYKCVDNSTLAQIWNTSDGVSWAVSTCPNGCDNTTQSCQMAPIYQGLLSFGVIVVFIVILLGLDKVLKR